jgi:hypothetical protein
MLTPIVPTEPFDRPDAPIVWSINQYVIPKGRVICQGYPDSVLAGFIVVEPSVVISDEFPFLRRHAFHVFVVIIQYGLRVRIPYQEAVPSLPSGQGIWIGSAQPRAAAEHHHDGETGDGDEEKESTAHDV